MQLKGDGEHYSDSIMGEFDPHVLTKKKKMRPVERIDNFLSLVDWDWLLFKKWDYARKRMEILTIVKSDLLKEEWMKHPDMRIGQLLINMNLIEDDLKVWLLEESDILLEQGIAPIDCLYWVSILDKDGNLLSEPKSKLIKDLDKDHIIAIIKAIVNGTARANSKQLDALLCALAK